MKRRLKHIFLAVILLLAISQASYTYYHFVSETIYRESVAHLTEIFHQSTRSLQNFVERNWTAMHLWAGYLEDVTNENEINEYITHTREDICFTEFYFVSKEGRYYTITGKTGHLDLGNGLFELFLRGEDKIVNSVVPGHQELMIFLTPANGYYQGFSYQAIAIGFNNSDLVKELKITAFNDASRSFMIHSDGRVILDYATKKEQSIYNFLAILRDYSDLNPSEIEQFQSELKKNVSGAYFVKLNHVKYYMISEPVQYEDWIMVGLVPVNVVNVSMNKLQYSTVFLVIGIMIIIGLLVISVVVKSNAQKLKKKDTEIIYQDELFAKLSTHVDDVFLMIDKSEQRIDYISPNIEKLIGITVKDVKNDIHILDCLEKNMDEDTDAAKVGKLNPGQQVEWNREYIHLKSGEKKWFHIVALCSQVNEEIKYILVMSDRTKERKVNQALEEAVNAAESANRAKSMFLSNMSHDIRTPMNAIIGYSTLARANVGNEEKVRDYLDRILSSGNHLLSLLNDILDMSRIESGKIRLEDSRVNLSEILHNLKNIIGGQILEKQLKLIMDTRNVVDEDIFCDKVRLNQVLLNLLSNAIKFTAPGGTVSVSIAQLFCTSLGKGHYEIRVKDTGLGMSKEFAEKIFFPFERERTSTVSKIQGTGLGMAITKSIVDMMGGTIAVITEQGKGTEFVINLEFRLVTEQQKEAQHKLPCMDETECLKGKKVLLVDDSAINRDIAREFLEDYGMLVDIAENGQEAVDKVICSKPGSYDLILMDVQMPVMDGLEATRHIRALQNKQLASIPILATTANAFDEDKKQAFECGMDGFVSKPIHIHKLIEEIKKIS